MNGLREPDAFFNKEEKNAPDLMYYVESTLID